MAPHSRPCAFVPGQAVVVSRAGEQRVGEVVGALEVADVTLYEVSLEDVVLKGVWPEELAEATPEAVQATLGWLAMDPEFSHLAADTRELVRRTLLRQAYASFLERALDELVHGGDAGRPAEGALFAVGDSVALREGPALLLASVLRVTRKGGEVVYAVEALGDVRSVAEESLVSLSDVRCREGELSLGAHARLLASGHEQDDDFAGTICKVERVGDGFAYALAFDDGDILEDLSAKDVG